MIARSILRIRPPAERGSERQAQPEIRIDCLGRLLLGAQMRVRRQDGWGTPAGRAATARVCLSRHGALLYSTLHPPATCSGDSKGPSPGWGTPLHGVPGAVRPEE